MRHTFIYAFYVTKKIAGYYKSVWIFSYFSASFILYFLYSPFPREEGKDRTE